MTALEHTSGLRTFIPAKDFSLSRAFYRELGATEVEIDPKLSLFTLGQSQFYLQDAYQKVWAENTMLFLFVPDLDLLWKELQELKLDQRYPGVRLKGPTDYPWGLREIHLIEPAGGLWHFAVSLG
ncbi:VOC family protein [Neolewinella litorea]|uniref:Glyoxalase n=1 Tax=Neolewinella litorea TaxID=2562452 RepID=A0A4S4NBU0_9BACT|nr:glyoxalase [Neolewinella litorea]THH35498.1 glyoxalase [Neolewinella litorea]